MKILQKTRKNAASENLATFLDMETIRRRVSHIKQRWSPEIARARATEGARRRVELEDLVLELLGQDTDSSDSSDAESQDDRHGLSLVG